MPPHEHFWYPQPGCWGRSAGRRRAPPWRAWRRMRAAIRACARRRGRRWREDRLLVARCWLHAVFIARCAGNGPAGAPWRQGHVEPWATGNHWVYGASFIPRGIWGMVGMYCIPQRLEHEGHETTRRTRRSFASFAFFRGFRDPDVACSGPSRRALCPLALLYGTRGYATSHLAMGRPDGSRGPTRVGRALSLTFRRKHDF